MSVCRPRDLRLLCRMQIFAILALSTGNVPPTLNLENPDPSILGNLVPMKAQSLPPGHLALSNSFGFGGTNTCLAFQKNVDC